MVDIEGEKVWTEGLLDMQMVNYVRQVEDRLSEKYAEGLNPNIADARADLVLYLVTRFTHPAFRTAQTLEELDNKLLEKVVKPLQDATESNWENLGKELIARGEGIIKNILDDLHFDIDGGIDPVLGKRNADFLINLGKSVVTEGKTQS